MILCPGVRDLISQTKGDGSSDDSYYLHRRPRHMEGQMPWQAQQQQLSSHIRPGLSRSRYVASGSPPGLAGHPICQHWPAAARVDSFGSLLPSY